MTGEDDQVRIGALGPYDVHANWPKPEWITFDRLVIDSTLSPRTSMDEAIVEDFADDMKRDDFDFAFPWAVRIDGVPHLIDGFHRCRAAEKAGKNGLWIHVWTGTREQAIEWAAQCNSKHGLRRSAADKRRAVRMLLGLPRWAEASDREIAKHLRVRRELVAEVRSDGIWPNRATCEQPLENIEPDFAPPPDRRIVRRGEQEYSMTLPPPREAPQEREPGPRSPPGPFLTTRLPAPIVYLDIQGWLITASDRKRRQLADDAFNCIDSAEERLKHDETVRTWLEKYEQETGA